MIIYVVMRSSWHIISIHEASKQGVTPDDLAINLERLPLFADLFYVFRIFAATIIASAVLLTNSAARVRFPASTASVMPGKVVGA